MVGCRLAVPGCWLFVVSWWWWTSFEGDGGESLERFVGRVDDDADGVEGRDAEQRLAVRVAEDDPSGEIQAYRGGVSMWYNGGKA